MPFPSDKPPVPYRYRNVDFFSSRCNFRATGAFKRESARESISPNWRTNRYRRPGIWKIRKTSHTARLANFNWNASVSSSQQYVVLRGSWISRSMNFRTQGCPQTISLRSWRKMNRRLAIAPALLSANLFDYREAPFHIEEWFICLVPWCFNATGIIINRSLTSVNRSFVETKETYERKRESTIVKNTIAHCSCLLRVKSRICVCDTPLLCKQMYPQQWNIRIRSRISLFCARKNASHATQSCTRFVVKSESCVIRTVRYSARKFRRLLVTICSMGQFAITCSRADGRGRRTLARRNESHEANHCHFASREEDPPPLPS